jgi:hypothetical protein
MADVSQTDTLSVGGGQEQVVQCFTEPAQGEMSRAMPEAVAKTKWNEENAASPSSPDWHRGFLSEWYLVPEAAFALMPLPLVIQYRLKARKLSICPSQRIYVQASRPGLNKIPFQLLQLFANHKTNSYVDRTFTAKRKAN